MVGISESLTAPADDEVEITLIGGTAGYGESVLVHIGAGKWVVIDSCVNAVTGECSPLAYLKDLYGEEIGEHIGYVVCSHWHDDHIKGLSEIVENCTSRTKFAVSCSDDRQKWVYEMLSDYNYEGRSTKLKELTNTYKEANKKGIEILKLKQNERVFNENGVEGFALSPSQSVINELDKEVADAMRRYHKVLNQLLKLKTINTATIDDAMTLQDETFKAFENIVEEDVEEDILVEEATNLLKYKDIKKVNPNDRCVAMLISFNQHHVILGADLENKDGMSGWIAVADCVSMKGVKSSLFKIPHHGSETGYNEYFLRGHVKKDAVMKLSAWTKGDLIDPKEEMLRAYYNYSNNLYITTTAVLKKGNNEEDRSIRKEMNKTTDAIYELKPHLGIIRSRMKINSVDDNWQTDYFGSAERIKDDFFKKSGSS